MVRERKKRSRRGGYINPKNIPACRNPAFQIVSQQSIHAVISFLKVEDIFHIYYDGSYSRNTIFLYDN